jgi:indolepyruvate ferredoxin oxidoreductase alpha subunit
MSNYLLLGDEAIAQGALDAGLSGIYAYPGTPSTEIMEYVQRAKEASGRAVKSMWSANEKTAMESALGMSYAGKRAMVCMKHVGLNVAADAFMNIAITGVNGGLLIVVADDPSMHSSQNEQDSRYYGQFAMIPVLEPSHQQEAYDMVFYGFEVSERLGLPVMMRITTRMAHSRTVIHRKPELAQNELKLPPNARNYVLLPANARVRYRHLLDQQKELNRCAAQDGYNRFLPGTDTSLGIIACGLAYNYLMEHFPSGSCPWPVLRICQYPVPVPMVEQLTSVCSRILVLEEGYPLLEQQLRGLLPHPSREILGRLSGAVPRDGELNPRIVGHALGLPSQTGQAVPPIVANRPPAFCNGCGHSDMFKVINEVMEPYGPNHVFGDIGCYTLGFLPPYNTLSSCVDMGSAVTMAKGAADAGMSPSLGVIGDSTFTHSGMTGLLDLIIDHTPATIIIADNATTGMTGGQESSAFGRLESICLGLGIHPDHLIVLLPLRKHHEENVAALKAEVEYAGPSVVIFRRECVQTAARRARSKNQE